MTTLAFDTHKFVKELTAAGMKTAQAEVLANSYATLLTDRIATKDDLRALEDRLNARIAYAQVASVVALSAVIVLVAFLGG
ncbi:MAG: DUF1640 domain-containing protein [Candidatus Puniceispirillaceae bacterium]